MNVVPCSIDNNEEKKKTEEIDYRTLVKRSKFGKIKDELYKLRLRLEVLEGKGNKQNETNEHDDQHKQHHVIFDLDDHNQKQKLSINQRTKLTPTAMLLLNNIEEDFHHILFILLRQYKLFKQIKFNQINRSNVDPFEEKIINQYNDIQNNNDDKFKHPTFDKLDINKNVLRSAQSEPNLSSPLSSIIILDRTMGSDNNNINNSNIKKEKKNISSHEFSNQKDTRNLKYAKSTENLLLSSTKYERNPQHHHRQHFHVTKPDIHWILGTVSSIMAN